MRGELPPSVCKGLASRTNSKHRGTYGNVISFLVPLTASDALVREGMDIFETSLTEAVARAA
jgi:4-aminobutyrate aminotransferase-like enzyme